MLRVEANRVEHHDGTELGAAYERWLGALREARDMVCAAPSSGLGVDSAEAHRYLTRLGSTALWIFVEHADPMFPELFREVDEINKLTADNPDNLYLRCPVAGTETYRLWGNRGEAPYFGITIDAGLLVAPGARRGTLAQHRLDELGVRENQDFEIVLGPNRRGARWIELPPDVWSILVRQTFFDRQTQRPATLHIERLGQRPAPEPLDPAQLADRLRRAADFALTWTRILLHLRQTYSRATSRLVATPRETREYGGDPDIHYLAGTWRLAPDEALVIDVEPARRFLYWGFQLCNEWLESLDHRYLRVSTNCRRAAARADGTVRLVVAHQNPGVPNWLETAGHFGGTMLFRWLLAGEEPPVPQVRVVRAGEVEP